MLAKKPVSLPKLISYILSFTTDESNKDILENIFTKQIKSNDEFNFTCLNFGESKNINDLPEKLKNIFDPYLKDFIRYGSRKSFENNTNLSMYFSILSQIIKNYYDLPQVDQLNYINKLRDKLIMFVSMSNIMSKQGYDKMGWVKKDITNSLIQFKTNKLVLKIIADYLNLNIFIFNIIEDKIYVVSDNDSFDMFRLNIFLVFNDDVFEPLVYSNSNMLDYNTSPINKLITVDKSFIIIMDTYLIEHTPFQFNIKLSDLSKYLLLIKTITINEQTDINDTNNANTINDKNNTNNTNNTNNKNDTNNKNTTNTTNTINDTCNENEYGEIIPEESDANAYIKDIERSETESIKQQLVFKISPKMKLDELQTIAKKLNIDLDKKGAKKKTNKTKGELIEEINFILKK